ncbi:alpha-glucuronidase family glycosyl hydrolase [Roseimarinus sediminis]|uniref:alpha-glucuronidase family glycosyl hydrolase n=1 Tax=Roseimarinus sediminis TaxID=1610899 RepID=UPI003D1E6445
MAFFTKAEDGYELWLRYQPVGDKYLQENYRNNIQQIVFEQSSPTFEVIENELEKGLSALLERTVEKTAEISRPGILAGTPSGSKIIQSLRLNDELGALGPEGYLITSRVIDGHKMIVIASEGETGVLYGTFHFLRLLQSERSIENCYISEKPATTHRLLNHWDNLDRTVERGYAGFSIWDWHKLPDYIDPRYHDYARANASIGINGTVVSNVNANALILTPQYLQKIKGLAEVFRPYGIKVYLTARFSAPIEIGGLETADPLNEEVRSWWKNKVDEIYSFIPDFGGFLVKANSEGQPGPQDYERSHAEGANMLAEALAPHRGVVMWRAFVYSHEVPDDRAKQAYNEFKPLDGSFRENVFVQVKNGAIDFQPREPFHPLFGAMDQTPLMMEFQITQEYLGCATHLVYLAPLFEENLQSDTYARGKGSTVARVIDGSLHQNEITGMAGVSNIGTDRNWTGHPFGQANWYAFGRMAWNPQLSSASIADEWLRMTFTNNQGFIEAVKEMMLKSRETAVNYMTPLGLHHQMAWDHHWGPGPWVNIGRPDWTSAYYHRADSAGIGFDRSAAGSNAVAQYFPEIEKMFGDIEKCPEEYLLWFHHVPWDYRMKSGRSLWNEMCKKYYDGAATVKQMQETWNKMEPYIDQERHHHVKQLLAIQADEAVWWRNALLLYFQQYSKMPIPEEYEKPDKTLEYYQNLQFHYVPGI